MEELLARPPPPSAASCARSRSARAGSARAGGGSGRGRRPGRRRRGRRSRRSPEVTVQTWRSWTERTPSSRQIAAPTPSTSMPAGAASISTSSGSLIRRQEEARIRTAISRPTIGSTTGEPPSRTKAPATTTPSEPSASAAEWRSTPSRLMSSRWPRARTRVAATLPARPRSAEGEHAPAVDRGRVGEAADGGDRDGDADRDQEQAVDQRRQHLRALVAEGAPAGGRQRRQPRRDQGEDDRADVGEQVAGVGEHRQRAGEDRRRPPRPASRPTLIASAHHIRRRLSARRASSAWLWL